MQMENWALWTHLIHQTIYARTLTRSYYYLNVHCTIIANACVSFLQWFICSILIWMWNSHEKWNRRANENWMRECYWDIKEDLRDCKVEANHIPPSFLQVQDVVRLKQLDLLCLHVIRTRIATFIVPRSGRMICMQLCITTTKCVDFDGFMKHHQL